MTERTTPNYWDYLKVDQLLALQGGIEGDEESLLPDELHFIIVHQTYELWFKLVLRELRLGRDHLAEPQVPEEQIPYVVHHLRRVSKILELLVDQFKVMETLTPQDFLAFRDKLVPASGFQSFQLRELEILLGLEEEQRAKFFGTDPVEQIRSLAKGSPAGELAWAHIERARRETKLRDALHDWLHRTPIQGSRPGDPGDDDAVLEFVNEYLDAQKGQRSEQEKHLVQSIDAAPESIRANFDRVADEARRFMLAEDAPEGERSRLRRIRAALIFIESYRELPLLAWPRLLVDTVVEMEENLVLWRTRHARMVERVIGRRIGSGGSSGVDYLDSTTHGRIFAELWAVRTLLLPRSALPVLRNSEAYGFATE